MMNETKKISEAPESNAGDDFHVLWAARRCMELLQLERTKLQCIAIEGPASSEAEEIDPTGGLLLGIDLTEYYEGDDFQTSSKVVFSQLKYSTRRADVPYTLSKLCSEGRKPIFKRLAQVFKGYCSRFPLEDINQRVRLKLISNRYVDPNFLLLINQIQYYLGGQALTVKTAKLKRQFPVNVGEIDRLKKVTGLLSGEFTAFLRLLDFEDCGAENRLLQKHHILKELTNAGAYEIHNQYNGLYMLINQKMLPEGQVDNTIRLTDILPVFGKARIEDLFPLPPKLEVIENLVLRAQSEAIAQKIVEGNGILCLHGMAGVGKTSTIQSIESFLPSNSLVIRYDCYGGGTYLDDSTLRHSYFGAITQICNELSNETGSPLLIVSDTTSYDELVRQFRRRVEVASELIREQFPEALLTIVIDAADNSVTAAKLKDDRCFVHGLVSLINLPRNCRLVFTCRTGNIASLKLPKKCRLEEVCPFTETETEDFLKCQFSDATQEEVSEFHRLTHGIPRIQSYSVFGKSSLEEVFELLYPEGITVATLIDDQIREADFRFGNTEIVESILRGMVSMPRPIPLRYIALIAGTTESFVRDYCIDCWSGVQYKDGMVSFRDEDFESHITEKYPLSDDSYSKLADQFLANSLIDEYACQYLGFALFKSKRFSELSELTLSETHLSVLDSFPLRKREVQTDRIQLALKSSLQNGDNTLFLKLVFLMAEGAKAGNAWVRILENELELASQFSDQQTLFKLFNQITADISYGAAAFRCAAILSREQKSRVYAARYLAQGRSWVRWYFRLPEEDRPSPGITTIDITAGAETVYNLQGLVSAERWLLSWKPKDFVFKSLIGLFKRVVTNPNVEIAELVDFVINSRLDVALLLVSELNEKGIKYQIDLELLCNRVLRLLRSGAEIQESFKSYIVDLCEHASSVVELKVCVQEILQQLECKLVDRPPHFFSGSYYPDENVSLDLQFRSACLRAALSNEKLNIDLFIPPRCRISAWRGKKEISDTERREGDEFRKLYPKLLRAYEIRAKAFSGSPRTDVSSELAEFVGRLKSDYSFSYSRHDVNGFYSFIAEALAPIVNKTSNPKQFLRSYLGFQGLDRVRNLEMTLILAETASKNLVTQDSCLKLLSHVDESLSQGDFSATEEIEKYLRCSSIALEVDSSEASEYFKKAGASASKVDQEAYHQIYMLASLSDRFKKTDYPSLAVEVARFVENSGRKLGAYDKFPWSSGIRGVERLDYVTAMWSWCCWDHSNHVDVSEEFPEFILHGIKNAYISPAQTCGLLEFWPFSHLWLEAFEEIVKRKDFVTTGKLLSQLQNSILTLCPLDQRSSFVKEVIAVLEAHGFGNHKSTQGLRILQNFMGGSSDFNPGVANAGSQSASAEDLNLVTSLVEATTISSAESITEALTELSEEGEWRNRTLISQYLVRLKERCDFRDYVDHLNAYCEVDIRAVSYYDFENGLIDRLNSWRYTQSVKSWMSLSFPRLVKRHFDYQFQEDEYSPFISVSSLTKLASHFGKTELELALAIKAYLTNHPSYFGVESFYQLLPLLAELLEEPALEEVLLWSLGRWNHSISPEIANGLSATSTLESVSNARAVAHYLRYCLGHPRKSIRWEAVHALRGLANYADTEILGELISIRNRPDNGLFQSVKYPFYHQSSKLWLFVALHRISNEFPTMLVPFRDELFKEAIQKTNAHALIRWYAKEICLILNNTFSDTFDSQEVAKLGSIFTPKTVSHDVFTSLPKTDEFPFDDLDTTRYWYASVASMFGISIKEFKRLGTHYIRSLWGYDGNPIQDSHLDLSSREYHKVSNRHGKIPEIENLQTYFEYHSMFFVANDLIENVIPQEYEYNDSFDIWLSRWLIGEEGTWLSDQRSTTPLEQQFWRFDSTELRQEGFFRTISFEEFDSKVSVSQPGEPVYYVVYSEVTRVNRGNDERVSIDSALVGKEKSQALLKTLQTYARHYDYKIPEEGEEDFEIDEDDFQFRGWIVKEGLSVGPEESIDSQAKELGQSAIRLGQVFNNWYLKNIDRFPLEAIPYRFESWSDYFESHRTYPEFGTRGNRLLVRQDVLSAFLGEMERDLLIECEIRKTEEYDDNGGYLEPSVKIYLITSESMVKTIREVGRPNAQLVEEFNKNHVWNPLDRWRAIDKAKKTKS